MRFFDENNFMPFEGRVEAREKVTGSGKYAAEYSVENVCYAAYAVSSIASGSIKSIAIKEAEKAQGVLKVITHKNKRTLPGWKSKKKIAKSRAGLTVLHTDQIYFKGQPVAVVVAESWEDAVYAASLIKVEYIEKKFEVDFESSRKKVELAEVGKERGKVEEWSNAGTVIEEEYTIAAEVHNPMEMHATIAEWTGSDKLKLYDKNQGVNNVQRIIGELFNIPTENIEVFSEFVGGGFGSGLRVWSNTILAALAAKTVKRPVKLVLTRQQMFSLTGYRPASWQKMKMGANEDGVIQGAIHQAQNSTSVYETFNDGITRITRLIYTIPNLKTEGSLVPLNLSTPVWMRGPGDCTGDFAVESALDEIADKLSIDPVEMRVKNVSAEKHPESGLAWSTNYVLDCVKRGAEMIGWDKRIQKPRSKKEGDWYTGYGMAVGAWNAGRGRASVGIILSKDGSAIVQTAMTDIGTGTGTGLMNMIHEMTGIPKNKISIKLGHSSLPAAGSQGGSTGLSSLSGAAEAAGSELKKKLIEYASEVRESFKNLEPADIRLSDKGVTSKVEAVSYAEIWEKQQELNTIDVEASSGPGKERDEYAFLASAAHFVKLSVNEKTGKVRIDKYACVADGGKIVNQKAATNQMSGAVVGGIGMALMEEQHADARLGGLVGDDLAGYHFAVNADAPIIEIDFINKPDPNINPSGAKGLGEVGIIGSAAAISNAIFNATGKRFRHLPITPDKILLG
jgi:xanthine dehydrogenase YagR molybdenum-binding subunit